jgi:hypothetical protein
MIGATAAGAAAATALMVLFGDLQAVIAGTVEPARPLILAVTLAVVSASLAAQTAAMRDAPRDAGRWGRRFRALLTAVAALIAAGASASGMWNFMGDVLHIDNLFARAAIFAVFEIALFVEALRARAIRINNPDAPRWGPDAIAVWVFAITTGVLAATDESTWAGRAARIALALTAAWLFERLISEEREVRQGKDKADIAWKFSIERLAVMLGLADPTGRTTAEVDRDRRLATIATLRYRADTIGNPSGWPLARWRRTRCVRRYRAALQGAVEALDLANDTEAVDQIRRSVALLHHGLDGTSAAAVADFNPWISPVVPESVEAPSVQPPRRQPPAPAPRRLANPKTTTKATPDDYRALLEKDPYLSQKDAAAALGVSVRTLGNPPWKEIGDMYRKIKEDAK